MNAWVDNNETCMKQMGSVAKDSIPTIPEKYDWRTIASKVNNFRSLQNETNFLIQLIF
jgi:hypothetical protein